MKNRISAPVEVLNALRSADRDELGIELAEERAVHAEDVTQNRTQRARENLLNDRLFPAEALTAAPHLAGIVEQHETHRTGNVDQVLGIEQEALVAAEDETGRRIARTDAADVEAADAVLAAEEQPSRRSAAPGCCRTD